MELIENIFAGANPTNQRLGSSCSPVAAAVVASAAAEEAVTAAVAEATAAVDVVETEAVAAAEAEADVAAEAEVVTKPNDIFVTQSAPGAG